MFLLLLFVAGAFAMCTKDTIYTSFKNEVIPHRDNATALVIDAYIAQKNGHCLHLPLPFNGASIVEMCDSNGDGVITLSDWNNATGCSIKLRPYYVAICNVLDCP
jgi:hypothetical protein